jgi:hypothetical protein
MRIQVIHEAEPQKKGTRNYKRKKERNKKKRVAFLYLWHSLARATLSLPHYLKCDTVFSTDFGNKSTNF